MPKGYRRILIGSDLSPLPADIVDEIRKLAAHEDSTFPEEIHLAFVLEALQDIPIDLPMAGLSLLPVAEEALNRLNQIVRDLKPLPTRLSTAVYHGKADKTLAALASTQQFDLILVVSHGRPLISRLMTGSLPGSLVHISPVPVLVIKDQLRRDELSRALLAHLPAETLKPLAQSNGMTGK
ncbi:MAG: universal stress protein [Leptospirillia bacterium]